MWKYNFENFNLLSMEDNFKWMIPVQKKKQKNKTKQNKKIQNQTWNHK